MIGIICATDDEIRILKNDIEATETVNVGTRTFFVGNLYGKDVCLVQSNIGKVAAGVTVALMAMRFKVEGIVFTGTAGSVCSDCGLGDIVIADKLVQHDFDIPWGPMFRIPIVEKSYFDTDKALSERLMKAARDYIENDMKKEIPESVMKEFSLSGMKTHTGTVASGDVFVRTTEKKNFIRENVENVKCTEMEGAAAAQAAFEMGIPMAVARIISDKADEDGEFSYDRFVETASSLISAGIVRNLLKNT
ncbi:MAG: 5'-methylthioadenosine/adenosylhomocysteine nucleosidase [Ruminococcaceae bacterium]|nr:5'-methylthioadenosine/adenosylhomocysteine nucleosidase [Oscillospiraceae bacterium]